jgi:hypothetical protein
VQPASASIAVHNRAPSALQIWVACWKVACGAQYSLPDLRTVDSEYCISVAAENVTLANTASPILPAALNSVHPARYPGKFVLEQHTNGIL